jgi:integrase
MLRAHSLDWASTQLDNCRTYLLSPTGRFQQWCRAEGIALIDDLTTERVSGFLTAMGDRKDGPGLKASTVAKYRMHTRSLAHFQARTPGYGDSLHDIDRIPAPRMARERVRRALSVQEEERIVAACETTRDRLIIELFLATGVRVSEMAALQLSNVMLEARPPRILVQGSVHDPDCTKNGRSRHVPFRKTYASLPRRLEEWIRRARDPRCLSLRQELFLGSPRVPAAYDAPEPLGIYGFERLCGRISERSGVHFSPHVLRHTWATRMVNAGVQPIHLMAVGGWSSVEMVRRYYTLDADEILAALAAAGA